MIGPQVHLFPRNGHFSHLLLLLGGDHFYCFAQPCGFSDILLYHYFWTFLVVPYSYTLPHTHVAFIPHHTSPNTPSKTDPCLILVQSHQGPTSTNRSQKGWSPTKLDPIIPKYTKRLCSNAGARLASLCRKLKFTSYLWKFLPRHTNFAVSCKAYRLAGITFSFYFILALF